MSTRIDLDADAGLATAAADPIDRSRGGVKVELIGLERSFGQTRALAGFSLEISPGELVALLGPSGCGKTTALRALAGLEHLDRGRVVVGGRDVTALAAHKRDMGMVFQAYSLFPNMTVAQNVAFGLKIRSVSNAERRKRAGELLELVGLSPQASRYPSQLSGGQQQRVALARALAIRPSVLLLDEPLSALDAKVRAQLRDEIRRIQLEVGTTALFVTHDQEEALSISDRVGVMSAGRLEQLGTPADIYDAPATAFVAEFVGSVNRLAATVLRDGKSLEILGSNVPVPEGDGPYPPGSVVDALVRPESFDVTPDAAGGAMISSRTFLGPVMRVVVVLPQRVEVVATVAATEGSELPVGAPVAIRLSSAPLFVVPHEQDGA